MMLMNLQMMNQFHFSIWADKLSSDPKRRRSTGMTVLKFAAVLYFLMLSAVPYAATSGDRTNYANENDKHEFRLLQHYQLVYAEEQMIFAYCVAKHRKGRKSSQSAPFGGLAIGSKVGRCMRKQIKLKDKILDFAEGQLGERSLAQGIYNECALYYPKSGVTRISDCVKTRLALDRKLDDDVVEKKIYQKCDHKWRKHGSDAIDNCSRTGATYYREKGRLQD